MQRKKTIVQNFSWTWKNCSSFSWLQKKGCLRTLSAEGLRDGCTLSICSTRSLATMSSGEWHRRARQITGVKDKKMKMTRDKRQFVCTSQRLNKQTNSHPHHVYLFADGRGCRCPVGCLLASGAACQKGGFPEMPRSRKRTRRRKCPRRRSKPQHEMAGRSVRICKTLISTDLSRVEHQL